MLEFRNVCAGYAGRDAVHDVNFRAEAGSITTLIGPNGCGKTTLLRTAVRLLAPSSGEVRLWDRPVSDYERRDLARHMAMLPQIRETPGITVRELVSHGRYPHLGLSRILRNQDRRRVEQAMEAAGVAEMAGRDMRTLSGGERQRAYIAMALAQDAEMILLDEPTAYLDLTHQFSVLETVKALNRRQGRTVVMVLHELSLALQYSDRLVLMEEGRMVGQGTPEIMLRSGQIERVFDVRIRQAEGAFAFLPGEKRAVRNPGIGKRDESDEKN